jgi:hypothetical protein
MLAYFFTTAIARRGPCQFKIVEDFFVWMYGFHEKKFDNAEAFRAEIKAGCEILARMEQEANLL